MRQKKKTFRERLASVWGNKKEEDTEKLQERLNKDLLEAAKNGRISEVRRLLGMGANKHARDADGNTPLMLASDNGYAKTSRILLENGKKK